MVGSVILSECNSSDNVMTFQQCEELETSENEVVSYDKLQISKCI